MDSTLLFLSSLVASTPQLGIFIFVDTDFIMKRMFIKRSQMSIRHPLLAEGSLSRTVKKSICTLSYRCSHVRT